MSQPLAFDVLATIFQDFPYELNCVKIILIRHIFKLEEDRTEQDCRKAAEVDAKHERWWLARQGTCNVTEHDAPMTEAIKTEDGMEVPCEKYRQSD